MTLHKDKNGSYWIDGVATLFKRGKAATLYVTIPAAIVRDSQFKLKAGMKVAVSYELRTNSLLIKEGESRMSLLTRLKNWLVLGPSNATGWDEERTLGKIPLDFIATFVDEAGHEIRLPRSAQSWLCRQCGRFVMIKEKKPE